MSFPATRLRRLRKTGVLRGLVRETELSVSHLVYPMFVGLDWGRAPLWVAALALGALAFGAMGVAVGGLAREVRAASLLAFLLSLPIAFLALVPSGSVATELYDVIRAVSAVFPFKPALDALDAAINGGGIGLPLLHLAILAAAFGVLARLGLRRFAA